MRISKFEKTLVLGLLALVGTMLWGLVTSQNMEFVGRMSVWITGVTSGLTVLGLIFKPKWLLTRPDVVYPKIEAVRDDATPPGPTAVPPPTAAS